MKNCFESFPLHEGQIKKLKDFSAYLLDWNRRVNLIANSTQEDIFNRHLCDSLQALNLEHFAEISPGLAWVDLGSGAGLPAIPLAIALPRVEIHAVERVGKKSAFQSFCKAHLGLSNFEARNLRYEDLFAQGERFGLVMARALDKTAHLLALGKKLLAPQGYILLWKGQNWKEEEKSVHPSLAEAFRLVEKREYGEGKGTLLLYQLQTETA